MYPTENRQPDFCGGRDLKPLLWNINIIANRAKFVAVVFVFFINDIYVWLFVHHRWQYMQDIYSQYTQDPRPKQNTVMGSWLLCDPQCPVMQLCVHGKKTMYTVHLQSEYHTSYTGNGDEELGSLVRKHVEIARRLTWLSSLKYFADTM